MAKGWFFSHDELAKRDAAIEARVRAQVAAELWAEAQRMRAEDFRSGKVGIEYVSGFEEAGAFVEASVRFARQHATDDHQETK
jgi:hypothetical protein